MASRKQKYNLAESLPSSARKVNLKEWISVDRRKPRKLQKVSICDADWYGWADYEFPAIYNGSHFIVDWADGKSSCVDGATYWKPRK